MKKNKIYIYIFNYIMPDYTSAQFLVSLFYFIFINIFNSNIYTNMG